MHACEVCNAQVGELRRGRCWGCYARWVDARPVGVGARCITCSEKRRRVLKTVELFGNWKPMCFNCAGQLLTLDPMPATISELKIAVSRERRDRDRRFGKPDTRVFQYERRVGQRRAKRADETPDPLAKASPANDRNRWDLIEDDMIIEITVEDDTSGGPIDIGFDDLTQIRELIHELRPAELAG